MSKEQYIMYINLTMKQARECCRIINSRYNGCAFFREDNASNSYALTAFGTNLPIKVLRAYVSGVVDAVLSIEEDGE